MTYFCILGVLGRKCFRVTYNHQSICVMEGSTVDLPCNYQYPRTHKLLEANWHIQEEPNGAPTNLSMVSRYTDRAVFDRTKDKDCTLRITDLRKSDSAEYKFRFKTQYGEWGYSFPGITLTVTPASEEGKLTLTCSTTCSLTDNPTFIWFKNGQRLTDPKILNTYPYLDSISSKDAANYSCSVKAGYKEIVSPWLSTREQATSMNVLGIRSVALILVFFLSAEHLNQVYRAERDLKHAGQGGAQEQG
uniref:Ig-like domain-containing protein n=1 Tax=Esox lucius TaxID=8010 RepID=A0A6Q2YSP3_ESOLU